MNTSKQCAILDPDALISDIISLILQNRGLLSKHRVFKFVKSDAVVPCKLIIVDIKYLYDPMP